MTSLDGINGRTIDVIERVKTTLTFFLIKEHFIFIVPKSYRLNARVMDFITVMYLNSTRGPISEDRSCV